MPKTVVLTGITGFIAKRIAFDLLEAGHHVRGTLRSPSRADEVRAALAPHLSGADALDRLTFAQLDLTADTGWAEAMAGADVVMHSASPFPMVQPKNENDIIAPAVDGARRAMAAARGAGVTRVIVTSSVAAIEAKDKAGAFTEADWSDPAHPKSTAYYKSKTLAERAMWNFAEQHPEMQVTAINPALVLGAPMDNRFGTSLELVERVLSGRDPMLPDIGFGIVDVADVSAMHIAAMENDAAIGERFIGSNGTFTLPRLAQHLAARHPDRKIATRIAPKPLLRLMGLFDASVGTVLHQVGQAPTLDNSKARTVLGIDFTPAATAIDRTADAVLAKQAA